MKPRLTEKLWRRIAAAGQAGAALEAAQRGELERFIRRFKNRPAERQPRRPILRMHNFGAIKD